MTNIRTALLGPLLATATAFAGSAIARAEDQITIGAIVPSSGPFAEWGRSNTTTLNLLEKRSTRQAASPAKSSRSCVIYDDGAKPAEAANALRKLAGDDKVLAVAGRSPAARAVTFRSPTK
jgi:branched-chain amino acid transport system substrate-binding protein